MTPAEFRALALSLPDAVEGAHMGHSDFRVGGKIFATLGYPDEAHAVVILPPEEQSDYVAAAPSAFAPVQGAWGKRGATQARLDAVTATTMQAALVTAWRKRAPERVPNRRSSR
jgi:hypothetical protein